MNDFTKPHPATVLWWEQREKCRQCAHHFVDGTSNAAERCRAIRTNAVSRGLHPYCIDARLPEGMCGPKATIFTPITITKGKP